MTVCDAQPLTAPSSTLYHAEGHKAAKLPLHGHWGRVSLCLESSAIRFMACSSGKVNADGLAADALTCLLPATRQVCKNRRSQNIRVIRGSRKRIHRIRRYVIASEAKQSPVTRVEIASLAYLARPLAATKNNGSADFADFRRFTTLNL